MIFNQIIINSVSTNKFAFAQQKSNVITLFARVQHCDRQYKKGENALFKTNYTLKNFTRTKAEILVNKLRTS